MRKQRLMGLALVGIAALVCILAGTGERPEDRDGTAAVLLAPLGLYMVFTRSYILYDSEPAGGAEWEEGPGPLPRDCPARLRTHREQKGARYHGKKTGDRGPGAEELGGRERGAAADRGGADRHRRHRERNAEAGAGRAEGGRAGKQAV